jgi:hypothetical protein
LTGTTDLHGNFWFPDNTTKILAGAITKDEDQLTINVMTSEDSAFIDEILTDERQVVLHGILNDNKKTTIFASLSGSSNNYDFKHGKYNATFRFRVGYLFYNEHLTSNVNFKALIINFVNIDEWVSPNEIVYGKEEKFRREIKFDIGNEFSLKFFYDKPLTEYDNATTRRGEIVYVRIDSKNNSSTFKELLEKKHVIQDFLNFVITGETVTVKSIYGINQIDNEEKLIVIKDKYIKDDVVKFKSKRRIVFQFREHENRLKDIIERWFNIKKDNEAIYNYYVDSMYNIGAIELSYFKIAAFLEGYHRELVERDSNSNMRKLIDIHFELINLLAEEMEISNWGRRIIKTVLDNNRELSFKQRLRDIFEYYQDILIANVSILSFFTDVRLHKWIE